MLTVLESVPEGLTGLKATELHTLLPGPALLHLKGKLSTPLFISVLLHGNEHTGWEVIRKLLTDHADRELPRSISIFIGNIEAARYNQRFLDHQPDYNRIWNGTDTPEHRMMQQVCDEMRQRRVFLSIDIHNNTGKNPHYACVNKTYNQFLQVATLFSQIVVYFIRPKGVQTMAFAELCPAVTVECGLSGELDGITHAYNFLNTCLNLAEISSHAVDHDAFDLFHTVATVKITDRYRFGFDPGDLDFQLDRGIEDFNFRELPEGTLIGTTKNAHNPLDVRDEQGNEVSHQYFSMENGEIRSRKTVIPAMITLDTDIIRKDCLCYLMEEYPLSG